MYRRILHLHLAAVLIAAPAYRVCAEAWPTAGHDNRRTGVTSEHLVPPLQPRWVFRSPTPPAPGWPPPANGYGARKNKSDASFDDAFRVIAADGVAYFCSSAENALYAIDAATGRVRWTWTGEAAPRLAPTFHAGRLYFGADDGRVYCLQADDGRTNWVYDARLTPERMLGYGRFSSVWPIRTGVMIEDDTAYFAAGLFPSEGIFLYALDPASGRLRWRRQIDLDVDAGLPPQGELLATGDSIFLTSRVMPTRWTKTDGRPLPFFTPPPDVENNHEYRFYNGGTDARIWQDRFFVYGSACILAYDPDKVRVDKYGRQQPGDLVFNWFNARQAVFAESVAFLATDYHVLAVGLSQLPELARGECYEFEKRYKRLRVASRFDWMEEYERLVAAHGEDHPQARWIKQGPLKWSQADWEQWQRVSPDVFAKFASKTRWMTPLTATEAMILAGRVLFAGGEDAVYAIDTADGRVLWSDRTASRVRGLAVSDGRLLVSTIDGSVRCYQAGALGGAVVLVKKPETALLRAEPVLPEACHRAVEQISAAWADQAGYCLLLGGDARLARELAGRTRLHVQLLLADEGQARQTRELLLAAGVHGHRVCVLTGDLAHLPFPPYLFNVAIDQASLSGMASSTPLAEAVRVVRPLGGIVYTGSAGNAAGNTETVQRTLAAASDEGAAVTADGGLIRIVRGRLPDTADWTHNYGTPANTYCNEDQQVKGPFGILWYGDPGPRERIDRHATPPIPLVVAGIMFTTADDRLMAFDVYNGVRIWDRLIPGVDRSGLPIATSNMAASGVMTATNRSEKESKPEGGTGTDRPDRSQSHFPLYVVVDDRECWEIDSRTGTTLRVHKPPHRDAADRDLWAWIATDGQRLYGSRAVVGGNRPDIQHSDELFAIDLDSGQLRWRYPAGRVEHDGIALGEGRLFLVDEVLSDAEKQQALQTLPRDPSVPDRQPVDRRGQRVPPDLRKLVAFDAATGQLAWQMPFDATDITLDDTVVSGGRVGVACMVKDGVVIVHGTGSLGHPHREFLAGEFARRALYAFASESGRFLWGGRKGYRKRPIIVGQQVFAEPFAWDLKTGRQRTIENPLSGQPQTLDFHRGYIGCSHLLASGVALFGNKPGIAYWNVDSAEGFVPFDSLVFGCGICATPACGVFLAPEGRSGCTCPAGIHTSLALYPKKESRAWGVGFTGGRAPAVSLPVRHAAINLGAPGGREDDQHRLWLPYPARGETGLIGSWLPRYRHKPEQFYYVTPELLPISNTNQPWLYTSGCQAETDFKFRLIEAGGAAADYTVRLHFAESEELAPGQRVFDVLLQGDPILKDFDIVQATGAPRRALVKEFAGVRVAGELTIGLRRSKETSGRKPILCAIEAVREE